MRPASRSLARKVQRVEPLTLVEHRRVRRIEILRLRVAHRAPAKAQHLSLRVDDGKDGAPAEHIVRAAVPLHREPRAPQKFRVKALFAQMADQRVPAARRGPKPEAADVRIVQSAPVEVIERLRALFRPQERMKISGCRDVRLVDAFLFLRAERSLLAALAAALGQRQMRALRQILHGLLKFHALHFHDEIQRGSALVAAETIVELRFGVHRKGRRLFIVEGATAPEAAALLLERDVFGHELFQIDPRAQLIQKRIRKPRHCVRSPYPSLRRDRRDDNFYSPVLSPFPA